MTIQHEYTDEDLRELSALLPFKLSRMYRHMLVLYVCIYFIILCERPNWWTIPFKAVDIPFLCIAGIAVASIPLFVRRRLRSMYRQKLAAALQGAVQISIDEQGTTFKTTKSETTMDWSLFERKTETDNFIALYATSGAIRPFPKRAFNMQQLSELRAILHSKTRQG